MFGTAQTTVFRAIYAAPQHIDPKEGTALILFEVLAHF
jgi:hypothetical protein